MLTAELHDCLIADDIPATASLEATGNAADTLLVVDNCTITNETVQQSSHVNFGYVNFIQITNSIICNPALQSSTTPAESRTRARGTTCSTTRPACPG